MSHPTRRALLEALGAAGLAALLPRGLLHAAPSRGARTVVFLHLRGGNDGLNAILPPDRDRYRRLRPTLALSDAAVLGEGREVHPSLAPLAELYGEGRLAVVEGVGWPRRELSHFRKTAIWHAASERTGEGWVARATAGATDGRLSSVAVDREPPLLFHGAGADTLTFLDPAALALPPGSGDLRALYAATALRGDLRGAVARRGAAALETASRLARLEAVDLGRPDALAKALGLALSLTRALPGLRAVHLAQDGYDTHAGQARVHDRLLGELAGGLVAFQRAADRLGLARRVVVVAYSEFGRRAGENASAGTDHGTAGPVLFVGDGLTGGFFGRPPVLDPLEDGDPVPTTDLRRVVAEVLAGAWHLDPVPVVGSHAPLEILS